MLRQILNTIENNPKIKIELEYENAMKVGCGLIQSYIDEYGDGSFLKFLDYCGEYERVDCDDIVDYNRHGNLIIIKLKF